MIRNLVTGADGFVGQHLVVELLRRGEAVVGAVRELPPALTTLSETDAARVRWTPLDLERPETVREVIVTHQVDRVFHLAGLSSVTESHADPVAPLRVNTIGTLYVLNELAELRHRRGYDPRVLITGSSQVYGRAASRCRPLTEDSPLEPLSPYAVSKAAQEMLGMQFSRAHGLEVVVTRSFNHTGPGQRPTFVAAQLATRIKEIRSSGGRGTVRVGDPDVRRDFTDVRDVVRAYILLSERGRAGGVYNVCSGRAYAVGELLEILAELGGVEVDVQVGHDLRREVDIPEMVGSYARLSDATGWIPQIGIRDSLAALLGGV
ncbi:MAG: GDP-mannose 4,6-dehydratase [Gemmatimonadota bacterium]|nr:MAG: GDP-mannose 4,6-dehydratase [Gemmatimonadota bacterium]